MFVIMNLSRARGSNDVFQWFSLASCPQSNMAVFFIATQEAQVSFVPCCQQHSGDICIMTLYSAATQQAQVSLSPAVNSVVATFGYWYFSPPPHKRRKCRCPPPRGAGWRRLYHGTLSVSTQEAKVSLSSAVSSVVVAAVQVLATGLGAMLVDKAGRKALLVVSSAMMTVSLGQCR